MAKTLANDELEANTPDESRLPQSMNDPEKLRKHLELAKKRLAERQRLDAEELAKN